MLTQQLLKERLSYCAETGVFIWNNSPHMTARWNARYSGTVAGTKENTGYITIKIMDRKYIAHRMAWLYVFGEVPFLDIDHMNGIKSDNRISNLRCVTSAGNSQNRRKATAGSKSGLLGASKTSSGKWRSVITVFGVKHYLGVFETPELAHDAYISCKRLFHSTCTI